jgi:hypothetical protein
LKLDQELWLAYEKFGTGQWKTMISNWTNVDRRVWFEEVKQRLPTPISVSTDTNSKETQQQRCETIVQDNLEHLKIITEQYQSEFLQVMIQMKLDDPNTDLEEKIEFFIQQHGRVIFPNYNTSKITHHK